jgi:hypothetical protein
MNIIRLIGFCVNRRSCLPLLSLNRALETSCLSSTFAMLFFQYSQPILHPSWPHTTSTFLHLSLQNLNQSCGRQLSHSLITLGGKMEAVVPDLVPFGRGHGVIRDQVVELEDVAARDNLSASHQKSILRAMRSLICAKGVSPDLIDYRA